MPTVNVHQAKTQLSRLLALAEDGEEVVIARRGEPVARLVACKPKGKRRFGAMKGQIVVDDSVLEPLPGPHRGPFARMLIAQEAVAHGLDLVSIDAVFDGYGVNYLW